MRMSPPMPPSPEPQDGRPELSRQPTEPPPREQSPEPQEYAPIPDLFEPPATDAGPEEPIDSGDGPGEPTPPASPAFDEEPDDAVTRIIPVPVRIVDAETGSSRLEVRTVRLRHRLLDSDVERVERAEVWRGLRDSVLAQLPPELAATMVPQPDAQSVTIAAPETSPATKVDPEADTHTESPARDSEVVAHEPSSNDVEDLSTPPAHDAGESPEPEAPSEVSVADRLLLGAIADLDAAIPDGDRDAFSSRLAALNELLADRNVQRAEVPMVLDFLRAAEANRELTQVAFDSTTLVRRAIEQQLYAVLGAEQVHRVAVDDSEREHALETLTRAAADYRELATLTGQLIATAADETVDPTDPGDELTPSQVAQRRLAARARAVTELADSAVPVEQRTSAQAMLSRAVDEDEPIIHDGLVPTPEMRAFTRTFVAIGDAEEPEPSVRAAGPQVSEPAERELADLDLSGLDLTDAAPEHQPMPHLGPDGKIMATRLNLLLPMPTQPGMLPVNQIQLSIPRYASNVDAARELVDKIQVTAKAVEARKSSLEMGAEPERAAVLEGRTQTFDSMRERLAEALMAHGEDSAEAQAALAQTYQDVAGEFVRSIFETTRVVAADVVNAFEDDRSQKVASLGIGWRALGDFVDGGINEITPVLQHVAYAHNVQLHSLAVYTKTIQDSYEEKATREQALEAQQKLHRTIDQVVERFTPLSESTDPMMRGVRDSLKEQLNLLRAVQPHILGRDGTSDDQVGLSPEYAGALHSVLTRWAQPDKSPFNTIKPWAVEIRTLADMKPRPLTSTELASRPPRVGVPYVPGENPPTLRLELHALESVRRTEATESYRAGRFYQHKSNNEAAQDDDDDAQLMWVRHEMPLDASPVVILSSLSTHLRRFRQTLDGNEASAAQRDTRPGDQVREFNANRQAALDQLLPEILAMPLTREGAFTAIQKYQQFQEETDRSLMKTSAADVLTLGFIEDAARQYTEAARRDSDLRQDQVESKVANAAIYASNAVEAHRSYLSELERQIRLTVGEMRDRGSATELPENIHAGLYSSVNKAVSNQQRLAEVLSTELTSAFDGARAPGETAEHLARRGSVRGFTVADLEAIADALHDQQLHLPFQPLGSNVSLSAVAAEHLRPGEDPGGQGAEPGPQRPDNTPGAGNEPRVDVTGADSNSRGQKESDSQPPDNAGTESEQRIAPMNMEGLMSKVVPRSKPGGAMRLPFSVPPGLASAGTPLHQPRSGMSQ